MGKIKHLIKIKTLLKNTPTFSAKDIELIVGSKGYAHLLLHNLFKKEDIFRLTKNCYSFKKDLLFSVFCFRPAYLGLQEALSLHNLWEQETNTVILTTKKAREGLRQVLGGNILVKHIPPQYFFGFEFLKYGDYFLPVSDLEKTLIDFIYFKEPLSKEVLKSIKRRLNRKKFNTYLKSYPLILKAFIEKMI